MVDDDRTFNAVAERNISTVSTNSGAYPQEIVLDRGYVAVSCALDENTIKIYTITEDADVMVYFDADKAERYALEVLSAVALLKGLQ